MIYFLIFSNKFDEATHIDESIFKIREFIRYNKLTEYNINIVSSATKKEESETSYKGLNIIYTGNYELYNSHYRDSIIRDAGTDMSNIRTQDVREIIQTNFNKIEKVDLQLNDMVYCIETLSIHDDDLIVKIDDYIKLEVISNFTKAIMKYVSDPLNVDGIVKYSASNVKMRHVDVHDNCIVSAIAMKCKYLNLLNDGNDISRKHLEKHDWYSVSKQIPSEKLLILKEMGIHIQPHMMSPVFI